MTDTAALTDRALVYVVPCGAAKLDRPAAARDLYTGAHFRNTLATAELMAAEDGGTVLILSARYGLVELDEVLAPYDVTMSDDDSITTDQLLAGAIELGLEDAEVYALLPAAYRDRLATALERVYVTVADVFEGFEGGIGHHRRAVRIARDTYAA